MDIQFERNGVYVDIGVDQEGRVALWNCATRPRPRGGDGQWCPLVEVQGAGYNQNNHHGNKHTLTSPAFQLRYEGHELSRNEQGDVFTLSQRTPGVRVTTRWQFYDGVCALRAETLVENTGCEEFPLQYVSSFALTGLGHGEDPRQGEYRMGIPHSTWYGECQWKFNTLEELGYDVVNDFSMKRVALSNAGTWACGEHLPMGAFVQPGHSLVWQIETSASWCWEVSDLDRRLYLRLSGPSWVEHQFLRKLKKGESFRSVPCALAFSQEGFEGGIRELTTYRRRIRRPNRDNEHPSVIFNDYMNCLSGDPTTEKEIPLIEAAARAGCKYYCVDCGWYDDGPWWDGVGEWLPAKKRFPGGLQEVLDFIRQKGMIPGLWLELEVMGIQCALAGKLPDECFFQLGGRRVIDESRYQLDFRHPRVIAHANGVVDRLVRDYGVGYIKMDYNINAGVGTDLNADSPGEGLLAHTRAYLAWLDGVFARYPDLVIENCSSGGMRMEYSHLSRHSVQSVTDQTDYVKMACIACNCMTACTPEQAAIWSYPLREGDEEETAFNMVNAMLFRIHQSGHLPELSPQRRALVEEGIACHLSMVEELKDGLPFWPIGLGRFGDPFLCVGVDCGGRAYLALWHTVPGKGMVEIPLAGWGNAVRIYPQNLPGKMEFGNGKLRVELEGISARLLMLER
ncbi:MAG: glycoside hydrolase family 36 protein [Candidatus Limiplasma sp.]|nr:glycoside hydrolase family 36 protein [Candidatus Limiplasma sp.]